MSVILKKISVPLYFAVALAINGCKKNVVEVPFDQVFSQPYSKGTIKFLYKLSKPGAGITETKDTLINFSSIGDNPENKYMYGHYSNTIPWVMLFRANENNFQNRISIFFSGTVLDSLKLPYTFKTSEIKNAQINYTIGPRPFYDSNGVFIYGTNTYAATTNTNNFTLTVSSRQNNRLQGIYSGMMTNQDGLQIKIEKGLFDIAIVEK